MVNQLLRDEEIAEAVQTSLPTIERTRRRFVEEGLGALDEKPRPGRKPVLNERGEARLIAEACSAAPGARALDLAAPGRSRRRVETGRLPLG